MGLQEHLEWRGTTRQDTKAPKVHFSTKMTKMPLVHLGLTKSQNPLKTVPFIVLHQTRAPRWFLTTLTKIDSKSTLGGPKNPNFDLTARASWNQRHCEDYQILIPTTIHESKSELEWPRYHENQVNAQIDAPLTSKSHNFWSDHLIFKFHTFSETRS